MPELCADLLSAVAHVGVHVAPDLPELVVDGLAVGERADHEVGREVKLKLERKLAQVAAEVEALLDRALLAVGVRRVRAAAEREGVLVRVGQGAGHLDATVRRRV